jgi:hypothetical protein
MIVERPVTDVYEYAGRRVGLLQTTLGPLRVTPEHPIYDATTRSFVPAGSLTEPFAALELASSWSTAPSTLSAFSLLHEVETVYNLTVADVHTYFANGLLVHNKQPPCGPPLVPLCLCGIGGSCGGAGGMGFGGVSGAAGTGAGGMSYGGISGAAMGLGGVPDDAGGVGTGGVIIEGGAGPSSAGVSGDDAVGGAG